MHHISLSGDMVMQGTFLTPTGVFLVSMTIMYLVTALLHPEEFGMVMLYNCKKKNVCCVHCMLYCINSLCNAVLCYFLLQG